MFVSTEAKRISWLIRIVRPWENTKKKLDQALLFAQSALLNMMDSVIFKTLYKLNLILLNKHYLMPTFDTNSLIFLFVFVKITKKAINKKKDEQEEKKIVDLKKKTEKKV